LNIIGKSENRDKLWANKYDPSDSPEALSKKKFEMNKHVFDLNEGGYSPSKGSTSKKVDYIVNKAY
jgi:hypothetical protein